VHSESFTFTFSTCTSPSPMLRIHSLFIHFHDFSPVSCHLFSNPVIPRSPRHKTSSAKQTYILFTTAHHLNLLPRIWQRNVASNVQMFTDWVSNKKHKHKVDTAKQSRSSRTNTPTPNACNQSSQMGVSDHSFTHKDLQPTRI
jgi:hypothetical protein